MKKETVGSGFLSRKKVPSFIYRQGSLDRAQRESAERGEVTVVDTPIICRGSGRKGKHDSDGSRTRERHLAETPKRGGSTASGRRGPEMLLAGGGRSCLSEEVES